MLFVNYFDILHYYGSFYLVKVVWLSLRHLRGFKLDAFGRKLVIQIVCLIVYARSMLIKLVFDYLLMPRTRSFFPVWWILIMTTASFGRLFRRAQRGVDLIHHDLVLLGRSHALQ